MRNYNVDENYVMQLANTVPGVCARLANEEEDCGYHKADVIVKYKGETSYFQVSRQEKSKREVKKLKKRGTIPIHTFAFKDRPLPESRIIQMIQDSI